MFDEDMLLEGSFEVEHAIVAGGGSGGASPVGGPFIRGGSGGAGDALIGTAFLGSGSYPIVVGQGGASRPANSGNGLNGGDSSAFGLTAKGGGGGGAAGANGLNGGSGGGGGSTTSGTTTGGIATGAGYNGSGGTTGASWGSGGGAGGPASGTTAGPGVASSISGTSVVYSRGGDGNSIADLNPGRGGTFGASNDDGVSDPGRDGIVIIRYRGPQRATGGTVTTVGDDTVHTFTSNGTFEVL